MTLATIVAGAALVLAGGTVVDGYGNDPIPDGIVVIEGDRILAVGGVGEVVIPDGAEIISTEGMTVLPGLWDMQANLMRLGHGDSARWNETYGPLAERVVMPIAARQLLAAGVTSARDVAAPLDAAIHVRNRVRERIIDGPDLYVSGPALASSRPPARRTGSGKSAAPPTCARRCSGSRTRAWTTCSSRTSRCGRRRSSRPQSRRRASAGFPCTPSPSGRRTSCAAQPRSSTASSAPAWARGHSRPRSCRRSPAGSRRRVRGRSPGRRRSRHCSTSSH